MALFAGALDAPGGTEVEPAGEFPDDEHIRALDAGFLEGGSVVEGRVGLDRPQVREHAHGLADAQEALFGALGGRRGVVLGGAHGAHEDRIRRIGGRQGGFGDGLAGDVQGRAADEAFAEVQLVAEDLGHGLEDLHALFDDLDADAVAGKNKDIEFHGHLRGM